MTHYTAADSIDRTATGESSDRPTRTHELMSNTEHTTADAESTSDATPHTATDFGDILSDYHDAIQDVFSDAHERLDEVLSEIEDELSGGDDE